jgi:hypothetical protein
VKECEFVQDAFGYVLLGVVVFGSIAAVVLLAGSSKLYDQIGRGGLSLNEDLPAEPSQGGASFEAERDDDIRQMLTARNSRREARGEERQDVEAELAELTRPYVDPALRAEIRELVVARNSRRVARGREPLDVEAEVERRITELSG